MEQFQSQRGADAVTLVYTCHGTICRNGTPTRTCYKRHPPRGFHYDAGPAVRGQEGGVFGSRKYFIRRDILH